MTCGHWNGALSPCPACECGERVGMGLPVGVIDWLRYDKMAFELNTWESDWRGRLGAHTQIEASWGFCCTWLPIHVRWQQLRQAAAKLRRMRACSAT